jgi:hypothetical protein
MLLPALHRVRDAEQGYPLRELLSLMAEQVEALEENLEQLYDDQFIETCAPWVVPYLGDLIGHRTLHGVAPHISSPRADVANTIRYRRRKGTAAMLEQMARDVTNWPARAVEFFKLLGWTQNMNHIRRHARYSPDLRNWQQLKWVNTAFDTLLHTVDVRSVTTGDGRYNIPNIGLFLWRVGSFPLTRSPAVVDRQMGGGKCFRFNPLGIDMPLYSKALTEDEIIHLAEPKNVPMPLDRRWAKAHIDDYYGRTRSFLVISGDPPQPVVKVEICDLSDTQDATGNPTWAHLPAPGSGMVVVDPMLGRLAFADPPAAQPLVSFHYGFTAEIGGGEYERSLNYEKGRTELEVSGNGPLQAALDQIAEGGTVKVTDSGHHQEALVITVADDQTVVLYASNGARPLLDATGPVYLNLGTRSTLIIDGLVIRGGPLELTGFGDNETRTLILRHCTLVPGPAVPSLIVSHPFAQVELNRCITGPLHVMREARVELINSILDATEAGLVAYRGREADPPAAGGVLTMKNCTCIGKVHASQIELASNCIFVANNTDANWPGPVWADRRQDGCMRFCYVPLGSITPRRFHCQPEDGDTVTVPYFASLDYGDPGYCQLHSCTSDKVRRGADNECEMGVLNELYQPQRETNLRIRLEEYLRFGLEAGIFYAS